MAEEFDSEAIVADFRIKLDIYLNRRAKRKEMDDADREVNRIISFAQRYQELDNQAEKADFLKQLHYRDFIRVNEYLRRRHKANIRARATEPFDKSALKRQKGNLLLGEGPKSVKDRLVLHLKTKGKKNKQLERTVEQMLREYEKELLLAEKEEELDADIDATSEFLNEYSDPRVPPRLPSTMHGTKSGREPASRIFHQYLKDEEENAADQFNAHLNRLPSNMRAAASRKANALHLTNAPLRQQMFDDAVKERLEYIRKNGLPGRDGPSSSSAASSSYGYGSLGAAGEAFAGEASSSPQRRPSLKGMASSAASSSYGDGSLGAAGEAFAGEASSSPQRRPSRKGLASAAREAGDARSSTRSSRISAFPRYEQGVFDPEFEIAKTLSLRQFADEEGRRTAESRASLPKGKGKAPAARSPPSGGKSRSKSKTRRLSARTKRH